MQHHILLHELPIHHFCWRYQAATLVWFPITLHEISLMVTIFRYWTPETQTWSFLRKNYEKPKKTLRCANPKKKVVHHWTARNSIKAATGLKASDDQQESNGSLYFETAARLRQQPQLFRSLSYCPIFKQTT